MARGLDQAEPVYTPAILRAITFMANYSFSLYLIHYSIFVLLAPLKVSMSPYLLFGGGVVGSNVIAALLALLTEMRHRQLTKHLIKAFS
jgi:peptidoglycan/LPS O-acetylase OafA/YrhL